MMIPIDEPWQSWMLLAARVCLALVFLVSGLHKGAFYEKAVQEFRDARAPAIGLTLPLTIVLHIGASLCLIAGMYTIEASLALALFTVAATVLVHGFWRFEGEERLARSRIAMSNVAVVGGLLVLAAAGPGRLTLG